MIVCMLRLGNRHVVSARVDVRTGGVGAERQTEHVVVDASAKGTVTTTSAAMLLREAK